MGSGGGGGEQQQIVFRVWLLPSVISGDTVVDEPTGKVAPANIGAEDYIDGPCPLLLLDTQ